MVVAALEVGAEAGQQLDAVGGHLLRAPLVQVGEAHTLLCPALKRPQHTWSNGHLVELHHTWSHATCDHVATLEKGAQWVPTLEKGALRVPTLEKGALWGPTL